MGSEGSGHGLNQDGWKRLLDGFPWFLGDDQFPLPAYSEFMPPPRLGRTPCGGIDSFLFSDEDIYGWHVSEFEEEHELKPGLEQIAQQIMTAMIRLGSAEPEHHILGHNGENVSGNPYWPSELSARTGQLNHERYVILIPLALSKTQDDKGRVRWTLFGGSEQGPEQAFWNSFYTAPDKELPQQKFIEFIARLISRVYGKTANNSDDLRQLGFRILLSGENTHFPYWDADHIPSCTRSFVIEEQTPWDDVRYLLTFRPFAHLPERIKEHYFAGKLNLLPFPGSLAPWGMPTYLKLQQHLPMALQIPILRLVARRGGGLGYIRIPQSGWIYEPHPSIKPSEVKQELVLDTYKRANRWNRVHRYEDELSLNPRADKVAKVLFSTELDVMGLYDKPMARNCQLWNRNFELLLNGPDATPGQIEKAESILNSGGLFGYRFLFPAMRVGKYEVYWQRPLVAYLLPESKQVEVLTEAPLGYITAYKADAPDLANPIKLWPRLLRRDVYLSALHNFNPVHDYYMLQTPLNIVRLLDNWQINNQQPLERSFTRALLRIAHDQSLEEWLASLPERAKDIVEGYKVKDELEKVIRPDISQDLPEPLTYTATVTRSFEESFWRDIQVLSHGLYINKDNADLVQDQATLSRLTHHRRDLEQLGNYLVDRHQKSISENNMEGRAVCGALLFRWRTDFDFSVYGGWKINQEEPAHERNILVMIPGNDRSGTIIMADHYDTAYMEDVFKTESGARLSAAGADDNHSATSTLLQAAPIFLKLAREGRLERDIWLLHLTGEEFPADCLGARNFCQGMVEGTLKLRLTDGTLLDLSKTRSDGVFIMDMIAHNSDHDRDMFQISPGESRQSLGLAYQAHLANMIWNRMAKSWNLSSERRGKAGGKRSSDSITIPEIAAHPYLYGEVRTKDDPRSSLYNTDGQIFSDVGMPVVLFMENYDISRTGYHDTGDTMQNIDLDYGAALASIAIETVARTAALPKL